MIEVGEYVRINNDFKLIALGIGQVIRINQDTIYVKMNFELPFAFKIENIAKHSKSIIDLIKVGDIIEINKEKYEVIFDKSIDKLGILIPNRNCLEIRHSSLEHIFMEYEDIKILTKEQYMKNCYTVERKEEC